MPLFFLYRHIRNDINVPFYVGIGIAKPQFAENHRIYGRAYDIWERNSLWKQIVSATSYDIDILYHTDNTEEIKKKEVEFIALYGRTRNNTGTLVNYNIGGALNENFTETSRRKLGVPIFAYKHTGEYVGEFYSAKEAAKYCGISMSTNVTESTVNGSVFKGYIFFKEYKGESVLPAKYIKHGGREVVVLDIESKSIFKVFPSVSAYRKYYRKGQKTAYDILNNKLSINGQKFCFKDDMPNEYK